MLRGSPWVVLISKENELKQPGQVTSRLPPFSGACNNSSADITLRQSSIGQNTGSVHS